MSAKEMILADAIQQAIEAERKIIKLKRIIIAMFVFIVFLIFGYFL